MFLHGPKGGGQEARNKFHSLHEISGLAGSLFLQPAYVDAGTCS